MQRFRRLFALLFILSLFAGAIHITSHTHDIGEPCDVCVLVHAPGLLAHTPAIVFIEHCYTPFITARITPSCAHYIPTRSRSPPAA